MESNRQGKRGFSGLQVGGIVLLVVVVSVAGTLFFIRFWLFPKPFTPVVLNQKEEQVLASKLERFENLAGEQGRHMQRQEGEQEKEDDLKDGVLTPEPYSEENMTREITFTERELNGLLAKNTDLADKVAIDLADDLVSVRLLLPVDPDFPILGGKTIRARAGAELAYRENRPVVVLRGVSLMGVPVPNAWLGGLKNIDLVQEFGNEKGFWKTFSEGVESIQVREGQLYVKLKE